METKQPEVNITAQTMASNESWFGGVVPIKDSEMVKEELDYVIVPNISWEGVECSPLLTETYDTISPPCQVFNISWQTVGSSPLLADTYDTISPPCQDFNMSSQEIGGDPLLSNRYEVITPPCVDSVNEGLEPTKTQPFCLNQEETPDSSNQLVEPPFKKHRCDFCDKSFKYSGYLKQHIRVIHSGGQLFRCITCGKKFLNEDILHRHFLKHSEDKPFKCLDCPKQYHYKGDLRRHIMSHTESKSHICSYCGKSFSRRDHLENHHRVHAK